MLGVSELSTYLRTDPRTIRRWCAQGRIRALRNRETGSSRVKVARYEVGRYLESLAAGSEL